MEPSERYSAFWPVLIFLVVALFCYTYQLAEMISHRSAVDKQLQQAQVDIPKAQAAHDRLIKLLQDLVSTATTGKDQNAMRVIVEAKQAGILREQQNAPSTNAAPATPAP